MAGFGHGGLGFDLDLVKQFNCHFNIIVLHRTFVSLSKLMYMLLIHTVLMNAKFTHNENHYGGRRWKL